MTTQHGGKRPGAGRKPGVATKKTRDIAERALADGITPLEVMLEAMRMHVNAGRWDDAAAVAKDAAPFVHPKLSSIEANVNAKVGHEDAISELE